MKFTILVLAIIVSLFVQGQEVNIYWGKENPVDKNGFPSLLAKRGDNILGYKYSKKGRNMVRYAVDDLQIKNEYPLIGKSKMEGQVIDNDYTFNTFLNLKNKLFVSVFKYDRKADLNTLYAQEIDESGRLTGKLKKLADISATSRRNVGSFMLYASQDSMKMLVVNNPPYEKYSGEKFGFKIFDDNLNEIKKLEVSLPYKDKNFSAEDYILSKDGTIFLLAKIELEKKEKKSKKEEAGYYYEIISINTEGKGEVTEYEVKLPEKEITDLSYMLDGDKNIICSGFYGNIEKGRSREEINGIFYLRINRASKTIEAKGLKEFDKDFIEELTSRKSANKGYGISKSFSLNNFIKKADGGAMLIAENSYMYVVQHCSTDPKTGARSCSYTYHYVRNNIIAVNINPDGSLKWYANIPKYQHTINDNGRYSSYLMATKADKIYFIYNDDSKNLDPSKVKSPKDLRTMSTPSKSSAVLVELSESGEFSKKLLFSNKENKMTLMPESALRSGTSEFVIPALNPGSWCCVIPLKKPKYKLARFEFK